MGITCSNTFWKMSGIIEEKTLIDSVTKEYILILLFMQALQELIDLFLTHYFCCCKLIIDRLELGSI